MSKYQQIRVRIEPVYPQGLAKAFPKLHRALAGVDNRLIEESPSLFELAPLLVDLSQSPAADAEVKAVALKKGQAIIDLHRKVGEAIGGWKLSAAETMLNDLEDAFAELEKELPKL
ncbi:MAG: hypothetical protein V1797_00270 [Pseudomonadota bacterium]